MTTSNRQKAFHTLAAALFAITRIGAAQESSVQMSSPVPSCAGDDSCPDRPALMSAIGAFPAAPAQIGVVTTGGMGFAMQESAEVVKHQPYQAVAITEIRQTLADGSHISQTTTATVARDSDGRTTRIQQLSAFGPWRSGSDRQGNGPTLTSIFDPIAMTHIDYNSDNKVAHILKMPPLPAGPSGTGIDERGPVVVSGGPTGAFAVSGVGPMAFAVQGNVSHSQTAPVQAAPDVKTESLGEKNIEGIPVTGTKSTTTIPAGAIGNDKELMIVRETWYSPELKLVMQSKQSDPRFGESTYTLTNIQRSEPDSRMFQVPPGYSTDKVPVHFQMHQVN